MASRPGIRKMRQPELEPDAWDRFEKAMDRLLKKPKAIDTVALSARDGLSVPSLAVSKGALLPERLNSD